jgi:hypothetical protein
LKKARFFPQNVVFFEEKHDFSDKIGTCIFFGKKVKLSAIFSKKS